MSGLEVVASVVAVVTISYQSISSLYNTIEELNTLPKEIEAIKQELSILRRFVEQVTFLSEADKDTLTLFKRFGLQETLLICARVCEDFHQTIAKWEAFPTRSQRFKLRAWIGRKRIQAVRIQITSAKETTILTVVSIQLLVPILHLTTG